MEAANLWLYTGDTNHVSRVLTRPHSPTGDLGEIAGVNGQNSEGMCPGGKPGTGKLYTDVCLCCSAHTSECVVDGLGATAAF